VLLRFNTKFIELDKTKLCSPEAHIIWFYQTCSINLVLNLHSLNISSIYCT
jgi:hypothetical protein